MIMNDPQMRLGNLNCQVIIRGRHDSDKGSTGENERCGSWPGYLTKMQKM
jgi:hypothetical protein